MYRSQGVDYSPPGPQEFQRHEQRLHRRTCCDPDRDHTVVCIRLGTRHRKEQRAAVSPEASALSQKGLPSCITIALIPPRSGEMVILQELVGEFWGKGRTDDGVRRDVGGGSGAVLNDKGLTEPRGQQLTH